MHRRLPEVKVLIILCYFFSVSVLALIADLLTAWRGQVIETLSSYFLCQSTDIQSGLFCSKSGLNAAIQATFDVIIVIFALIPLVNLLYAVNFSTIKRLRKYFQQCSSDGRKEEARKQISMKVELSHL